MELITNTKAIAATFNALLDGCKSVSFAVAWASYGFDSCERLLKLRRKINRGVVGMHFFQTDPKFIETFRGSRTVKFVVSPSGVFHPKVYLFEGPNTDWHCILGSANFTSGGFGGNSEAVLHIDQLDDRAGEAIADLRNLIESYFTDDTAKFADEIDLDQYRYWKDRFRRTLAKSQSKFGNKQSQKNLEEIEILNLKWPDFLNRVRNDPHHGLRRRLKVLSEAKALFKKYGSLAAMPLPARQGIGGYVETDEIPWGWFGSMRAVGVFKGIVNKTPEALSDALDCIPLTGSVRRTDYEEFVRLYLSAFPKKNGRPMRHGLATATRLLAMKRPDYFVCFDKANKVELSRALGIAIGHQDYDAYWDSIVETILEARWWDSSRPRDNIGGLVWDGRAALLDAIYYMPQ